MRLKQYLLFFILLLSYRFVIAQNVYYYEMLNGNAYDYSVSSKLVKMIEENKPDSLLKYIFPSFKIDTSLLRKECSYTSRNFSSKNSVYKSWPLDFNGSEHFYIRKYFQDTAGSGRLLFTVAFKLHYNRMTAQIDSLTFACDTNEVKTAADLIDKRKLLSRPLPKLPPLPPPPPDSLVKQLKNK